MGCGRCTCTGQTLICTHTTESERTVPHVAMQVKTDEYTMQNFHLVKYCHLNHFGSTLGLAGLAVVWQVASQTPYNLHISGTVFKVTAALFQTPYKLHASGMVFKVNDILCACRDVLVVSKLDLH